MTTPRILEVRQRILKQNDEVARGLRTGFAASKTYVVNLVSSPGSGKTSLLLATLRNLHDQGRRVAAIVGDLETDRDAQRLAASGAPVKQIMTHGCCHLEAAMIQRLLESWPLPDLEFLFIENVGNLVCPTSWDLGESLRVALLSVSEGEDKPLKYPGLFHTSDVAVITKRDLAVPCEFDRPAAYANIHAVRPGMRVFETSAKTGEGLPEWFAFLSHARQSLWEGDESSAIT